MALSLVPLNTLLDVPSGFTNTAVLIEDNLRSRRSEAVKRSGWPIAAGRSRAARR